MSTEVGARGHGRNWLIATLGGLALTLLAFVVVVVILSASGQGFKVETDESGQLTVSAEGEHFSEVVQQAIDEDSDLFEAVLSKHGYYPLDSELLVAELRRNGYYKFGSQDLVNALRELKSDEHATLTTGMRDILWDLEGPFTPPGVLDGAGHDLYEDAVLELNTALGRYAPGDPEAEANAFITRMILDQLDRKGLFKDRLFRAKVVKLDGLEPRKQDGRHVVYVCADSELAGRELILMPNDPSVPRHSRAINAIARVDPVRFDDCDAQTMPRYLARQAAHVGMPEGGFVRFAYGENGVDVGWKDVAAQFQVVPKNHIFRPVIEAPDEVAMEESE